MLGALGINVYVDGVCNMLTALIYHVVKPAPYHILPIGQVTVINTTSTINKTLHPSVINYTIEYHVQKSHMSSALDGSSINGPLSHCLPGLAAPWQYRVGRLIGRWG